MKMKEIEGVTEYITWVEKYKQCREEPQLHQNNEGSS